MYCIAETNMSKSLLLLYTTGTYYEVGYSIGSTFSERINRYWNESESLIKCDLPFYETLRGQEYFNTALKVCEMNFPQYIQEIRGLADGAKMPFDHVFKLNLAKEVRHLSNNLPIAYKEKSGCSDVYLNTPTVKILGHNEDCDFEIEKYAYMVSVRIVDDQSGTELENFTSFCYPGELPGTTVAFNRHGMVFTANALYAEDTIETAPPRQFVNRSLMKARSIDEVIELIKNPGFGVAIGFSLNVVDIKNPTCMWSVEVGPHANVSLVHVLTIAEEKDPSKSGHYYHVNNYRHLEIEATPDYESSIARTKRIEELPPPSNKHEVKCLLGDQDNHEYPIYRTKCPPDILATALTAIVDVKKNRIDFYLDNPSRDVLPLFYFNVLNRS
uniref:Peptidase C45 hydrolase domain-containing protein n=1 Tax=Biomphalaria glabrata TaxID=6526 RepID=A0A2C9KS79_BIOGL